MLFYGHSSHVKFSTQHEAVTAYLALHFIMIHLIRVIKLIWDAVVLPTVSLSFTAKEHENENDT